MDLIVAEYPGPEIDRTPRAGHEICVKPAGQLTGIPYRCREPDYLHPGIPVSQLCNDYLKRWATTF